MTRPIPIALLAVATVGILIAGVTTVVLNLGDAPPDVADAPDASDEPEPAPAPAVTPTPTPTPTRGPTSEEPERTARQPDSELDGPATTPGSSADEPDRSPPREVAQQPRADSLPATGGVPGLTAVGLGAAGLALSAGAARLTLGRARR